MKKRLFLGLFAIILSLFFFRLNDVKAGQCFRVCYKNNCLYSGLHVFDEDSFPEYKDCIKKNKNNESVCDEHINYKEVDSSYCNECFKVCYDKKCVYSNIHVLNENDFPEYKDCIKKNKNNQSVCDDKIEFYDADSSYCVKSSSGSNTSSSSNYNYEDLLTCGNGTLKDIPSLLPKIIHFIYLFIQILVPILIVIFGSIDFVKAVVGQKDEEIKKGQQTFIKRCIYGIIVFFVFSIVKLVISFAAQGSGIMDCASCIINNDCDVQ